MLFNKPVYVFEATLKSFDIMRLIDLYSEDLHEDVLENNSQYLIEEPVLTYNIGCDNRWYAGLPLLLKLKSEDEITLKVYIYDPELGFRLPDCLKSFYTLNRKTVNFEIPEKSPKRITILVKEEDSVARKVCSTSDYNYYLKLRNNPCNTEYYEKIEEENRIIHNLYCNIPLEVYKNLPIYGVAVDADTGKLWSGFSSFDLSHFESLTTTAAENGLDNICRFNLNYTGGLNAFSDMIFITSKCVNFPVIPACITFIQELDLEDTLSSLGPKCDWAINKFQPYLKPNIIFNINDGTVSNSSSDVFNLR